MFELSDSHIKTDKTLSATPPDRYLFNPHFGQACRTGPQQMADPSNSNDLLSHGVGVPEGAAPAHQQAQVFFFFFMLVFLVATE